VATAAQSATTASERAVTLAGSNVRRLDRVDGEMHSGPAFGKHERASSSSSALNTPPLLCRDF
jgi:hypothetical protein